MTQYRAVQGPSDRKHSSRRCLPLPGSRFPLLFSFHGIDPPNGEGIGEPKETAFKISIPPYWTISSRHRQQHGNALLSLSLYLFHALYLSNNIECFISLLVMLLFFFPCVLSYPDDQYPPHLGDDSSHPKLRLGLSKATYSDELSPLSRGGMGHQDQGQIAQ